VSVEVDSTGADAIEVMALSDLDHLLVHRVEGELGIVTDHDLIYAFRGMVFFKDV
jgi:CBS domain-containing protein